MSDQYIRSNIESFYLNLEMPGGYTFNHPETIRLIDLYYNSRYKTGQYDQQGLRKFFFNIVKPACDIATKFIDLDTKDINLIPTKADDEFRVWIMQKRLKQYLRDTDFGVLLNEISFDLPKYGTVVVKKCKKEWEKVNIQNLRMDPACKELEESPFVYELVTMSKGEIEEMKWDSKAKEELFSSGEETFFLYDCYHKKGKKWTHVIKGDMFSYRNGNSIVRTTEADINQGYNFIDGITLFEETVDELPYEELHWEKIPGRWLGFGFVEYLEDNQVAINEAENLERKGLMFTSLKLYQTRDQSIGGSNILTNTSNGDILTVESEITPLAMEERNLGAFNNTRANWSQNTERKTFTSDITTGASLPSRTPLGVANLQASFASSYFELKRENFGLFISDLVTEHIIPSFESDTAKEHELVFEGSDAELDRLDSAITEILLAQSVSDYAEKTGFFPSREQKKDAEERIKKQMKKGKNRYFKMPKDAYKNAKYIVDVVVTGENIDNGAKSQVIQLALNIVGTNPAILQNPMAKSLFFSLLSLGGISPVEIGALNQEAPQQPQQVAGSIAAPVAVPGMSASATQV